LHLATPAMCHGAVVDNVHVILDRVILAEGGAIYHGRHRIRTGQPKYEDVAHLAISLAIAAAKSGRRVYYGTLVKTH
jgi:hypothetical protein